MKQLNLGYIYFSYKDIFVIHLKLEIASAILAPNEWQIEAKNSAVRGLMFYLGYGLIYIIRHLKL